ncbi:MAG TPA: class II aldolase/adducin family protein [Bacteroidota bacterium]|nr:class II aldolase/adducin family protein [Bacteroidota bacterium]
MKFTYLHPRDEIIEIIKRIYQNGMTTTSGGNLSIKDDDGSIWITPKGVDKGTLTPADIVRVTADGVVDGVHEPSSEYPFHLAVYTARPDIKAIVHAHPPALVSFAITRNVPDTRIMPKAREICGRVGYAKYALPGSGALGDVIAQTFTEGHDTVLMENHGIVTVGNNLMHAFHRLETLDFCARLTLKANILGSVSVLGAEELKQLRLRVLPEEFVPETHTSVEKALRKEMITLIKRCYAQKLMTSTEGTFSARVDSRSFIITPFGLDRNYLTEEDLVLVRDGMREAGKEPSQSVRLHRELYEKHPGVNAVLIAQPPNILAFGVSEAEFDTRTIPESYLVLRTIQKLPYGAAFGDDGPSELVGRISEKTPVVICRNNCVVVMGSSLLQSYDRLEVAEFSAKAIIASKAIGNVVPIGDAEIDELEEAFDL